MQIAILLASKIISQAIEIVAKAKGHTVTDRDNAELVITDDAVTALDLLKSTDKKVVQFCPWRETAATGLLTSDYADRIQIFARETDQGEEFWLDRFGNFLITLGDPAGEPTGTDGAGTKEVQS